MMGEDRRGGGGGWLKREQDVYLRMIDKGQIDN